MTIGESGRVRAKVECDSGIVHGKLEGDLVARRKITLHTTARVHGKIETAGIVIEEDATFEGQIVIGSNDAPEPIPPPKPMTPDQPV